MGRFAGLGGRFDVLEPVMKAFDRAHQFVDFIPLPGNNVAHFGIGRLKVGEVAFQGDDALFQVVGIRHGVLLGSGGEGPEPHPYQNDSSAARQSSVKTAPKP